MSLLKMLELMLNGQENGKFICCLLWQRLIRDCSLPHEWEWQYVAQCGTEYRTYPWGNKWDESKVPEVYEGRERLYPNHPPADVNAHSSGRSPFGVYDLVGNIWQWTDVYQDQHTRAGNL